MPVNLRPAMLNATLYIAAEDYLMSLAVLTSNPAL